VSFRLVPACMMILVGLCLPIFVPFTFALLKCTVPKLASGSMRPVLEEGASTMTSADARLAEESDLCSV
jgi:hypothetical protein